MQTRIATIVPSLALAWLREHEALF